MRPSVLLTALLLALTPLWWGCDNSDDDSTPSGVLHGRVLDVAGQPLADVPILLNYELPYSIMEGDTLLVNVTQGAGPLWFSMPATTQLVITVHDMESHAVLDTLLDEVVAGGIDSLLWDLRDQAGRVLSADCYRIILRAGSESFGAVMLVNPDYSSLAEPWNRAARTNDAGAFAVREDQLAFRHNQSFNLINPAGWQIGSWNLDQETHVRVLARLDDGTLLSSDWLEMDLEAGVDVELQVP